MEEKFKKINLIHIIYTLDTGGLEKLVLELCRRIDNSRVKQFVCCLTNEGELTSSFTCAGIKVFCLGKKEGLCYLLPLRIAKLCRSKKTDIVHTHDGTANLYGAFGAKFAGVKKIYNTEHGRICYDTWRKKSFNKILARFNTKMVCVSQKIKSDLIVMGVPEQKLLVIPNGIDLELYKATFDSNIKRTSLGLKPGNFVICSVGRLSIEKNHLLLIEAAKNIILRIPETKILIVGDGPLRIILEAKIKELNLHDYVFLLGTRNDIPEILAASDCFVSTSNFESFGLAILEAMAAGVPVVATAVGGVPELVKPEITGTLVQPVNPVSISEAVCGIRNNPAFAKTTSLNAKKMVDEKYSIETMIRSYENLYLQ